MDSRELILEALLLYEKGEYADKIIKSILDKYSYLERFERSFINRVFNGTVERRLTLDFIINSFSSVKVNKQKPVIRTILRMSVYQIMYMDSTPDSAVVNEAVKLAKKKKFNGLSGFINGVLRKISREKNNISMPDKKDFAQYLSVMYSCPKWLCNHFINETSEDKTEEILKNSLLPRPVIVRTNRSKLKTEVLEKRLTSEGVTVKHIDGRKDALIIEDFDGLNSLESFNEGLYCVQDLSSQRVLDGMQDALERANLVVDVCAAPGGKTCHAADLVLSLGNEKCKVISRDLSESKVDKIEDNIDRCGFENVTLQVRDALDLDENLIEKADVVIADLPCSGLGVIGRKVDIKYRVVEEDLEILSNLQKDILKVVSQYVKPGGVLIFSTCTVNKLENIDNAVWIEENLPFERMMEPIQILNDSQLQDGFFISRFIKATDKK